jgi:hypothetical protein
MDLIKEWLWLDLIQAVSSELLLLEHSAFDEPFAVSSDEDRLAAGVYMTRLQSDDSRERSGSSSLK